jgi:hypothetical protein
VLCITTGESYDSIIKAAQDCGMSESAIGGACRRPAGKNYAGFLCEGKVKMIKNNNCKLERVFWSYL